MSFTPKTLDAIGLLEQHAKEVLALEEEEAKRLLAVYKRVAARLRMRLKFIDPEIFSSQQGAVILIQVEMAIRVLQKELGEESRRAGQKIAGKSLEQLVAEVNEMNRVFKGSIQPIDIKGALIALDSQNFLFNNYEASINAYTNSLRTQISNGIGQMVIERQTSQQIIDRLQETNAIESFFDSEEWRLRRIVRTEMHSISGHARLMGMQKIQGDQEPGMMKSLYHPMDHRTGEDSEYVMSLNLRVPIDRPFEYTWTPTKADGSPGASVHREFMAPPDRPNDRSILIPYHPSWD